MESGRYQKSPRAEQARAWRRLLPLLPLLAAACAPVDAQQRNAARTDAAVATVAPAAPPSSGLQSGPQSGLQPVPGAMQPAPSAPSGMIAPQEAPLPLAPAASSPSMAQQAVIAARDAMQRKQWSVLAVTVPQARADILGMYPEYWLLRYQLWNLPANQRPTPDLQNFLRRNADSYLGDKLRQDWLLVAARSGDFDTVNKLGPVKNTGPQTECAILNARHMTGRKVDARQAMETFAPGPWCWTLYDQLVADKVLGWEQLEPQLRDAIENNKTSDAGKFASYMFDPAQMKAYDALMRDPMKWLVKQPKPPRSRAETELVTIALARLPRKDLDVADAYFRREWAKSLPRENVAWLRGQYALVAVLNLDSRANDWYVEAGHIRMTSYNQAWKVRAALRQPKIDWRWVMASIDAMPVSDRADPSWIYWYARGLAATGRKEEALRMYAGIADQFNFYGQLAAEELGRPITVPPRPAPVTAQELAQARANPGLQRAIAMFRLGWRPEAVPEWNFAIRDMDDRQLLAAAELARVENIYDRVVNTSDRTATQFDFSQRYIAPFEGRVAAKANEISLDPAWVYGLIRQESRFIMDARSSVGASGLMQLMPATAKWVARKIGMDNFTPASVNDFDTNTILGTNYLNMVLQDLGGSQVLASAGYNAGPRRPIQWRSTLNHPVEGAIFAETIPFTETRTYVKNVMANATYYAAIFTGQPQSLKQRLGQISPQAAEPTPLP
ncbi:lytic transglycosylase domain-containing protein [Achromobacter aloeverae]|uniref:lytic transglycosylase domain-containing protein n=1 Tax=Achromobacter aloeverae TaxID=1750518 RepID=UPI003607649F